MSTYDWVVLLIVVAVVAGMVGLFLGHDYEERRWQREAIGLGVGEWVPNEEGNLVFHWKNIN
jgi:hypothetical protein